MKRTHGHTSAAAQEIVADMQDFKQRMLDWAFTAEPLENDVVRCALKKILPLNAADVHTKVPVLPRRLHIYLPVKRDKYVHLTPERGIDSVDAFPGNRAVSIAPQAIPIEFYLYFIWRMKKTLRTRLGKSSALADFSDAAMLRVEREFISEFLDRVQAVVMASGNIRVVHNGEKVYDASNYPFERYRNKPNEIALDVVRWAMLRFYNGFGYDVVGHVTQYVLDNIQPLDFVNKVSFYKIAYDDVEFVHD